MGDDCRGVGSVIWPDLGWWRERHGWVKEKVEVCALGDSCIVENDQSVDIVHPFDPEAAPFALPVLEDELEIPRLQFRREVGEVEDACYGCGDGRSGWG